MREVQGDTNKPSEELINKVESFKSKLNEAKGNGKKGKGKGKGTRKCFACKQPGHMVANCTNKEAKEKWLKERAAKALVKYVSIDDEGHITIDKDAQDAVNEIEDEEEREVVTWLIQKVELNVDTEKWQCTGQIDDVNFVLGTYKDDFSIDLIGGVEDVTCEGEDDEVSERLNQVRFEDEINEVSKKTDAEHPAEHEQADATEHEQDSDADDIDVHTYHANYIRGSSGSTVQFLLSTLRTMCTGFWNAGAH